MHRMYLIDPIELLRTFGVSIIQISTIGDQHNRKTYIRHIVQLRAGNGTGGLVGVGGMTRTLTPTGSNPKTLNEAGHPGSGGLTGWVQLSMAEMEKVRPSGGGGYNTVRVVGH